MPVPTLYLSYPVDQSIEQKVRRFLAANAFVQRVSSLVRDLQRLVEQQLWFEDLGTVLLVYTCDGEHVGYITAE